MSGAPWRQGKEGKNGKGSGTVTSTSGEWVCCNNTKCTRHGKRGSWAYVGSKAHTSCTHCWKLFPRRFKQGSGSRSHSAGSNKSRTSNVSAKELLQQLGQSTELTDVQKASLLTTFSAELKEEPKPPLTLASAQKKLTRQEKEMANMEGELQALADKFLEKQEAVAKKAKEVEESRAELQQALANQTKESHPTLAPLLEMGHFLAKMQRSVPASEQEAKQAVDDLCNDVQQRVQHLQESFGMLAKTNEGEPEPAETPGGEGEGEMEEDGEVWRDDFEGVFSSPDPPTQTSDPLPGSGTV